MGHNPNDKNKTDLLFRVPKEDQQEIKVIVDKSHIPQRAQHILEEFPDLKDNPRVTELLARIFNSNYPANFHGQHIG